MILKTGDLVGLPDPIWIVVKTDVPGVPDVLEKKTAQTGLVLKDVPEGAAQDTLVLVTLGGSQTLIPLEALHILSKA